MFDNLGALFSLFFSEQVMLIRLAVMPQNVLRPTMKCLTMFRRHGKEVSHSYLIGRCKSIFLIGKCT